MNKYTWLDDYLKSLPGCEKDFKSEWGWFRYMICGKQFAATCTPSTIHKNIEPRELVSLKCAPELSEALREEYKDIVPGFYLNKFTWISIYLDGEVPDDVLKDLCLNSYEGVFAKLTKKAQNSIRAGEQKKDS